MSRRPLQLLEDFGAEYKLNPYGRKPTSPEMIELLKDADGLIAGTEELNRHVLSHAPRLKIISRCGVGIDNVDLEATGELGIHVCNTPEAHVDSVAELTLAGILDVLRHVSYADRLLRLQRWEKQMGSLLREKTVGIIGLGRVGMALVRLLEPFDVRVLAYDIDQHQALEQRNRVEYCSLNELLKHSDIVTLHLPYTTDTEHVLDRSRLAAMKPGAIVVNCSRGGLLDEQALYELLTEGKLGGAYLDTFEHEPYDGPLTNVPNVVLTPHIGSYAAESRLRMEVEAVKNLLAFFQMERTS